MKSRLFFVLAFGILLVSLSFVSATTRTCNSQATCQSAISSSTSGDTVQMTSGFTSTGSYPTLNTYQKNGVTFDCKGYTINSGSTPRPSSSIEDAFLMNNSDGFNIQNCTLINYNSGIFFSDLVGVYPLVSNNSLIRNIAVQGSVYGIYNGASAIVNNTFDNITTTTGTDYTNTGIYLIFAVNNSILNSNFSGMTLGNDRGLNVSHTNTTKFSFLLSASIDQNKVMYVDSSYVNGALIYYNYSVSNYEYNASNHPNIGTLICSLCDNITIKNLNLTPSSSTDSIDLFYVNNSKIDNISLSGVMNNGIYLIGYNNNVSNITFASSSQGSSGIYEGYPSSNNLYENILYQNYSTMTYGFQFDIYGTTSTSVLKNSIINASSGIYVNVIGSYPSSLNISNVSVSYQGEVGILPGANSTFTNINITSNTPGQGYGIYGGGDNWTLKNSRIVGGKYGIRFYFIGGNGILVYNNLFNNTINYYNYSFSPVNDSFNTTQSTATNILGYPWFGGNYWDNFSAPGTGYSFTCSDTNLDGICDTPLSLDGVNYDYLPLTFDITPPTITIISPTAKNYADNNSISLNYTATDSGVGVNQTWYNVQYSNGTSVISNTTLSGNTTFSLPGGDNNFVLTLWSNDSLGNTAYKNITFGIITTGPIITLDAPSDNSYLNYTNNIYFNFTATNTSIGETLSTCKLYSNFTGTWGINQTFTGIISGTQNYTTKNLTDNKYLWNVWCNDTLGNSNYAFGNFTATVDTIKPLITFNSISTTAGLSTFTANVTINDSNVGTCKYSVWNSGTGTIDGGKQDISYACTSIISAATTTYGNFILQIDATDLAGNTNQSNDTFVTKAIPPGGGGGSSPIIINGTQCTIQDITTGYSPSCTSNQVCVGSQCVNSFCGDSFCQANGNSYGFKEDFYSCPIDCKSFNLDDLINAFFKNCFDKDPSTICFWTQGLGAFSIYGNQSLATAPPSKFNFKTAISYCFDGNPDTQCYWTSPSGDILILIVVLTLLFLSFVSIKIKGKEQTVYQYVATSFKKGRRRKKYG